MSNRILLCSVITMIAIIASVFLLWSYKIREHSDVLMRRSVDVATQSARNVFNVFHPYQTLESFRVRDSSRTYEGTKLILDMTYYLDLHIVRTNFSTLTVSMNFSKTGPTEFQWVEDTGIGSSLIPHGDLQNSAALTKLRKTWQETYGP